MARKRDPQELLARARKMEDEARRIRDEAAAIRKAREAKENAHVGAALRPLWKAGWTGVSREDLIETADAVFGSPPTHPVVPEGQEANPTEPSKSTNGDAFGLS